MNGLDLFSGIGGNTIGLRDYINTIAYCEADRHAQSVLLSRMAEGLVEPAPIWDDIQTLKGNQLDKQIDIIIGGFPCQDISIAGNGTGLEGKRSGLFYEVCRLVKEINPTFVFLENVPAIRTRGLREVIREFTNLGYGCRWTCVSAAEVGAPHLRKRWFLLAYSNKQGLQGSKDTGETRRDRSKAIKQPAGQSQIFRDHWATEPNVGRVVNGLPLRVDRIKRLGNAVVPAQAKEAFERLIGLK